MLFAKLFLSFQNVLAPVANHLECVLMILQLEVQLEFYISVACVPTVLYTNTETHKTQNSKHKQESKQRTALSGQRRQRISLLAPTTHPQRSRLVSPMGKVGHGDAMTHKP